MCKEKTICIIKRLYRTFPLFIITIYIIAIQARVSQGKYDIKTTDNIRGWFDGRWDTSKILVSFSSKPCVYTRLCHFDHLFDVEVLKEGVFSDSCKTCLSRRWKQLRLSRTCGKNLAQMLLRRPRFSPRLLALNVA